MRVRLALLAGATAFAGLGLLAHCSSFSGSDPAVPTQDAAANQDAAAIDVEGGPGDGGVIPGDGGLLLPFCATAPDAAFCTDFEGAFPPAPLSNQASGAGSAEQVTPGYQSKASFRSLLGGNGSATLWDGSLTNVNANATVRLQAMLHVDALTIKNTDVAFFDVGGKANPLHFFAVYDTTGVIATLEMWFGQADTPMSSPLASGCKHKVLVASEWTSVDMSFTFATGAYSIALGNDTACKGANTMYNPGSVAPWPLSISLGIDYTAAASASVFVDNVAITLR
jgi:hypothetical protein